MLAAACGFTPSSSHPWIGDGGFWVNCSWKCQPLASLLFKLHMLKTHTSPMQDLVIEDCLFSRLLDRVGFPIVTLKALEICDSDNLGFLLPELFRCHHPALEELKIGSHTLRILSSFTFTLSFSLAIFPGLIQFDIDALNGLESISISISEGEPLPFVGWKSSGAMISDKLNCPLSTWHAMRYWNAGSSSCWHSHSHPCRNWA